MKLKSKLYIFSDTHDFISCVRDALSECDNPEPSEIVHTLFLQLLNETPCRLDD